MASQHIAHATYYMDITLTGQNQGGNYSTLHIRLYANADPGWGSGTYASGIGYAVHIPSGTVQGSGSVNISGTSVVFADFYTDVFHDANGYYNQTIIASTGNTGTETYGAGVTLTQQAIPPRIPKLPGAPSISVASNSARTVKVNVGAPGDNGGAAISAYTVQYSLNGGGWTGTQIGGTGQYTFSNLVPGSYRFRAFATNSVGAGPSATTSAVTVVGGGKVRSGGAWKSAVFKVRSSGAWKDGTVKVRSGGAWKNAN